MRISWLSPLLLLAGCSLNPGFSTYGPPGSMQARGPVQLTPPAAPPRPVAAPPDDSSLGQPEPTAVVPLPAPVEQSPLPGPTPDAQTADQPGAPQTDTQAPSTPDQATGQPAESDAATAVPDSGQTLDQRLDAIRANLAQDRSNTPPPPPTRPGHYGGLSSAGDVVPNVSASPPSSP